MANELEQAGDTGAAESDFDMDAGVKEVAAGLGLEIDEPATEQHDATGEQEGEAVAVKDKTEESAATKADAAKAGDQQAAIDARPPPKSWQREMHEWWGKIPKNAQEYIELRERQMLDGIEQYKGDAGFGRTLRDTLAPYRPLMQQLGMDETRAVQSLLGAHQRLTTGSEEHRRAAYDLLGRNLGLVASEGGEDVPPYVRELQERQIRIESAMTAQQQAELDSARDQAAKEVDAFASDEKHPYFDEVADDIVALIKTGKPLDEAYEKAVWANPVTRQKEIARFQTEAEAKRREKAQQEADAAKRATADNIRGRQTRKAPTEPKGTWDDTMRDTLQEIKERAH